MCDRAHELCSSWQVVEFPARPVAFIRLVGLYNTANEVFHVVHFECPCSEDSVRRFKNDRKALSPPSPALPSQFAFRQPSEAGPALPEADAEP